MDKVLEFLKYVFMMSGATVRTNYSNRPAVTYDITSEETLTEQHGYKTLQEQVADLLLAGERLETYRKGGAFYDTDNLADDVIDDLDDDFSLLDDPTRSPDFTGFDAHDAMSGIDRDVKNGEKVARASKSKAKAKKSKKEEVGAPTEAQEEDVQLAGE